MKKHKISLLMAALASAAFLVACGETVATHGHIILPSRLAQIQPGQSTRADVLQLLGSPSTTGTMSDDRWYYMTNTTKDKPLNPNLLEKSQLVEISFDPSGTVTGLVQKTEADSKTLEPDMASTPTHGQALGLVDQLLGNIGLGGK